MRTLVRRSPPSVAEVDGRRLERGGKTTAKLLGLARGGDPGDSLQIVRDSDVLPSPQQLTYSLGDRAADFHNQPAAGFEGLLSCRDKLGDNFQARRTGKHSAARFELADFELNLVLLGFADVRGIGNDKVKRVRFKTLEQMGLMKLDPGF